MSTHRLAHLVKDKVSRSQLYDIMDVKRTMDLAEFEAICNALGLGSSEVFREAQETVDSPPPPPVSQDVG